jgi:uncharacterized protein YuzE
MKLVYDRESDALYARLSAVEIVNSEEVRPGVVLDFDAEGHIVAIEILDAAKQIPPDAFAGLAAA